MTRRKVFGTIGESLIAVVIFLVSAIVALALLGSVAPFVHKICIVRHGGQAEISDTWGFYLTNGLPNPAPDSEGCIRNTPTREALSALGLWKLGNPTEQITAKLAP